jgi:hypothetical protein
MHIRLSLKDERSWKKYNGDANLQNTCAKHVYVVNLKLEMTNSSFLRQPINEGKKVSCQCASRFTPMLFSFIDSHTKKEEENLGFLGGRITLCVCVSLSSPAIKTERSLSSCSRTKTQSSEQE